jgi:hypothetical protein
MLADHRHHVADEVTERHLRHPVHPAPGEVEEVGEEPAQPVRLPDHHPGERRPVPVLEVGGAELLHRAPDRGQGVLDLVGEG